MGTGPSSPTNPSGPSFPTGPSLNYGGNTLSSSTNPFVTTNPLSLYSIAQGATYTETDPPQTNISFTSLNNNTILVKNAFINSVNYFRANTRKNIFNSSDVPWATTLVSYITNKNSFKFHISGGSAVAAGPGTNVTYRYTVIRLPANIPTNSRLIITAYLINYGSTVRRPQVKILLYDNYANQANGNLLSEVWANQKVGTQTIRWSSSIKQPANNVATGSESIVVFNDEITAYYANMASTKDAFVAWGVDGGAIDGGAQLGEEWGLRFTASIQYPSVL